MKSYDSETTIRTEIPASNHSRERPSAGILPELALLSFGVLGGLSLSACSDQAITSLPTSEAPSFLQDARSAYNSGASLDQVLIEYSAAQEFVNKKFGAQSLQSALLHIEIGSVLSSRDEEVRAVPWLEAADNMLGNLQSGGGTEVIDLRIRTLSSLSDVYSRLGESEKAVTAKTTAKKLQDELY